MKTNKIAVVFDFDITLSPYYQQKELIKYWGIDEGAFWEKCTSKVINEDYDLEHAYIKVILEQIKKDKKYHISNKKLFELGKSIDLYNGLSKKDAQVSIFDDIDKIITSKEYQDKNIEVEYYIISGGLTQMILGALDGNKISHYFKKVYACVLDEDENGCINFPKETVGHTIKTQKLFQIAKGIEKDVNEKLDEYEIPFENIIFLGDGQTDIPAFSLVNKMRGTSIAVYREVRDKNGDILEEKTLKNYQNGFDFAIKSKRAKQLLPADYSSGKPLKIALINYIKNICENI